MSDRSVAHVFETCVETHPHRSLFKFIGGDGSIREQYSYGSFFVRTNYIARCLKEAGLRFGTPTLLVYPPGIEMAAAFFACMWVGIVPVPAPPPPRPKHQVGWQRLAHIARHAGAVHVLTTTDMAERIAALSNRAECDLRIIRNHRFMVLRKKRFDESCPDEQERETETQRDHIPRNFPPVNPRSQCNFQ